MVDDFLFELGCEELPTQAVRTLSQALASQVRDSLNLAQLHYDSIRIFATPRRLAVYIQNLDENQAQRQVSKRGPALSQAYDAEGKPSKPLLGFLNACQIHIEQLSILKTDKGEWVQYVVDEAGQPSVEIMPQIVAQALAKLPVAKPMRWGDSEERFVRPVHWILMMYGSSLVKSEFFGQQAGNVTYGHRFHHPQPIEIQHPRDYEQALYDAFVLADYDKRREVIVKSVRAVAHARQAAAIMPDELVDEVTSIVEWPVTLEAQFEATFLTVPQEALIASMQIHQKSFALCDANHRLLPFFISVANIESLDSARVIAGIEKVMRARLSDAHFFFVQDQKRSLSTFIPQTKHVIFQAQLGSLYDKSNRIHSLMMNLCQPMNLQVLEIERAAALSKCDLLTGMVGEFPELQGVMGYHYALIQQESDDVALALQEQYCPRFSGDILPTSALGTALSLTDRLDTLVGNFLIGQRPSGVKDPFKLRRHGLAVVRLLINNPAQINLTCLIDDSVKNYGDLGNAANTQIDGLHDFILDRLLAFYQAQDIAADRVQAVLARQRDWFYDINQRLMALNTFLNMPEARHLSAASKRVGHMLNTASGDMTILQVDSKLLVEPAEHRLFEQLQAVEEHNTTHFARYDYTAVLLALASLHAFVDAFFDTVMVMVEDETVKNNRFALLQQLQTILNSVADISGLQWPNFER